jgi:glutathione synthase/RimK-type ligase-like ATP-grasp enzyme
MQIYDLCLTWYWLYDHDFIQYIGEACAAQGVTLWQITPTNVLQAVTELYTGQATFHSLIDRAYDDLRFEPIRHFAIEHHLHRINASELSHWSEDKATMHLELIEAGLQTPYTILISPFIDQPILPALNLTPLGANFVLKPAIGGGGEGVRMNVSSLDDLQRTRLEFPDQKYLAQEKIMPRLLSGREAWFRVFYVGGECIPCWWNPSTHVYTILTSEEETQYNLAALHSITERIAKVCRLDWFSTEIAYTPGGRFVVVDYVNDGIDTRIQSKATDGMPDEAMKKIAFKLVGLVVVNKSKV